MRLGSSLDITFYDGVAATAARAPDHLAIETYGNSFTYRQLLRRCNRFANAVCTGLGLKPGGRIAVMAGNRIEYAEILVGASAVGIAVVPIGPAASAQEIAFLCQDSGAAALFVDEKLAEMAKEAVSGLVRVIPFGSAYDVMLETARDVSPAVRISERDIFCIPYTSGSTGRPKGVLLSQRGRILTSYCVAADHGCFTSRDRAMAITPLFHGAGILSLLTPLLFGASVNLLDKFDIEKLLSEIARFQATSSYMIPTHFAALSELGERARAHDTSSLKVIMCGTAPLDHKALGGIERFFGAGKLFQRYGSTETSVIGCLRPEDMYRKPNCAGQPFPMVNVEIRRPDGSRAETGEVGTICVASPFMFSGYLNLPEQDAATRDGDWFVTGDVGRVDEEGFLFIIDRKNSMIISGGENVYPAEVERVILSLDSVEECSVVGLPHPYWGEQVTAFVVAKPGRAVDEAAVKDACRQAMSKYKTPKEVIFLEKLPRNSVGKVARDQLMARAAG